MSSKEKVNILLVDDQPAKLMTLEAILSDLGENVVKANSADEALRHLLASEVAVVLVDVCMPRMDGFELAELIRNHPRFRRTAIIFISAVHLTDADRLKGYDLGAVDYIPVPIIPEVLRAKVAVFADLYRKTNQLERLNRELEQRVAERTADLEASTARMRASEERFQLIAHTIDEVFWLAEVEPQRRILYISPAWERIWGKSSEGITVSPRLWVESVLEEDRAGAAEAFDRAVANGADVWDCEYRIRRPDGGVRWVAERGRLMRSGNGPVLSAGLATDITARKEVEEALRRHRDQLDLLVKDRTAELERSHEALRLADRMATIGTLSAGLGHDMGNLLLPVRMRLDAIERSELSPEVREDMAAIRTATEYLQRLARSLRLLSLDPRQEALDDAATDVSDWWREVEQILRNAVGPMTALSVTIPPGLPSLRIGRAALTQLLFNLVQNAGDALKGRGDGRVEIAAWEGETAGSVRVRVTDNGAGMSEEVRQRCLEPFFTTKTRGLGTGLGLALVGGIVKRVGGKINVRSEIGVGTTIEMSLPTVVAEAARQPGAAVHRSVAVVELKDPRLHAHVASELAALSIDVRQAASLDEADLWITDGVTNGAMERVQKFAASKPTRRAIVVCEERLIEGQEGRVVCVDRALKPSALRARIRRALSIHPGTVEGAA